MNILKDKGRDISPGNPLIRAAEYDTVRTRTVLPLHQMKKFERDMKRQRIVGITKTPGEHDGFRLSPDSSSDIYMNLENESQCRIVAKNRRKQDEAKQTTLRVNAVKREALIIN